MSCPVCFDEIDASEKLSCGHCVHRKCILKWGNDICPLCKSPVDIKKTKLEAEECEKKKLKEQHEKKLEQENEDKKCAIELSDEEYARTLQDQYNYDYENDILIRELEFIIAHREINNHNNQ
jgi:hypothetical protein